MPEGPELYLASQFINLVCQNRIFCGKITKSDVSKNPEIPWDEKNYKICASSRGKEIKINVESLDTTKKLDIIFRFGMSGVFQFTPIESVHKHAHMKFFTNDEPIYVLSFVDVRRFGRWIVSGNWSLERGPDVIFEYENFRDNVLKNLHLSIFDKPICEVLLNQKYFNGIGNYLRAEILFRAGVPPFVSAKSVLEPLLIKKEEGEVDTKPDLLELTHIIPKEVIALGGKGYDPEGSANDYAKFTDWLQCYYKQNMQKISDHNGRTIWFTGEAGPLVPKGKKGKPQKESKYFKKELLEPKIKIESESMNLHITNKKPHSTNNTNPKKNVKQITKTQPSTNQKKVDVQSTKSKKSIVTRDKQNPTISLQVRKSQRHLNKSKSPGEEN